MQENKIKAGPYIGQFESGCVAWHGIKYASARRSAMPEQRFSPTNDVVCHKFGLSAAQAANPTAKASFAEDILSLNIYSPSADNKRRPVMVWIHGGAFQSGAGLFYNGAQFARDGDCKVDDLAGHRMH